MGASTNRKSEIKTVILLTKFLHNLDVYEVKISKQHIQSVLEYRFRGIYLRIFILGETMGKRSILK